MILMIRQQHQVGMESGEMNTSVVGMLVGWKDGCLTVAMDGSTYLPTFSHWANGWQMCENQH